MSDFAVCVPSVKLSAVAGSFTTRAAVAADVDALAAVMGSAWRER